VSASGARCDAERSNSPPTTTNNRTIFRVEIAAEPGAIDRVLAQFSRHNLIPDRIMVRRQCQLLGVTVRIGAMPVELCQLVVSNIRRLVHTVDVSVAVENGGARLGRSTRQEPLDP